MNELIVQDIIESGILVSFDKYGHRIPMNKRGEKPAIENLPKYILIVLPWSADFNGYVGHNYASENYFYTLRKEFFKEWIPAVFDDSGILTPVRGVELITDRLPIVTTSHELLCLADSRRVIQNYHLFELTRLNRGTYDWSIKPRFEQHARTTTTQVLDRIQNWFRELLGLQNPIFDGDVPHGNYICAIDTAYCKADVLATLESFKYYMAFKENNMVPGIKKVIFNKPCTIVLWEDGTKTMVRTQGKARFDKEKGLAMCIAKKALGNKGNYYDEFRKWVK